ncbi:MAG: hypothetical protein IKO99_09235 [Bacteroidales bacterium]|nr:hypothetical protein [Bacteroidales bacterium]
MLQTKVNNAIRLREMPQVIERQDAITGEIKQYAQLGLLLGLCKTAVSKDNKLFSNLLAFSIGGAAIGAAVGAIKYRKVSEEIFIKTQNFYASTQNNPPQENYLKTVTGYWKYEKTPKVYRGRKLLTYKAHFVFDDAYYKNNCVLLLLKNNVKYLISPCDNEHGYAYYVKFPNDKKWYELPLDYIPTNSLKKDLDEIGYMLWNELKKYAMPTFAILAAIIAIIGTARAGYTNTTWRILQQCFTIISSSYSIASNTVSIVIKATDKSKYLLDKIPNGYLNATIGLVVIANVDNEITKKTIAVRLAQAESIITINVVDLNEIDHLDNVLNVINSFVIPYTQQ